MYIVQTSNKNEQKQDLHDAMRCAERWSQDGGRASVKEAQGFFRVVFERGKVVSFQDVVPH